MTTINYAGRVITTTKTREQVTGEISQLVEAGGPAWYTVDPEANNKLTLFVGQGVPLIVED